MTPAGTSENLATADAEALTPPSLGTVDRAPRSATVPSPCLPVVLPPSWETDARPDGNEAAGTAEVPADAPPTCSRFDPFGTRAPAAELFVPPLVPGGLAIPGYEVLGELGRGGMGVVYKALDLGLKRTVALKMILAGAHAGPDQLARFRAEAEAVARLQHPNIVQIHEIGEHDGRPFFSLEFLAGGRLDARLAGTPLPGRTAAQLVETLARAMQAAHERGIVHRDLKPANVLLAGEPDVPLERCTPRITDFGLAKQLDDDSAQTQSGAILGTPSYMAPEQAAGRTKEIGPLSDVYALGAILYECLTGRPPFKAATLLETLEQVRKDEPVPPHRLRPKVPRDLETICLKCIDKQPHRRYASAAALADDLRRFLDEEPIRARRVRLWERAAKWVRRRPATAALVGVLAAVVLALPVAGLLFSSQLAQRRAVEQKRLDEARGEVHDLLTRGQTASLSRDWKQADLLLDQAWEKLAAEPALRDLRGDVEAARGPVKDRLAALDAYQRFVRDRDEALFHATLAGGEDFQANRAKARERAEAALSAVGLVPDGRGTLALGRSFSAEEQAEVRTGSYALLLMLAELEARRLPQQTAELHREALRRALALLQHADVLGVRTRAIHLGRARYLGLLGDAAGAAREREAARALASARDLDPQDHFLVGHELYSEGDLASATEEFGQAFQQNSQPFWTRYFLGVCCVTLGKPGDAVVYLTDCQSRQPGLVWVYLLRGFAYGQMNNDAAAERDFDRALELRPSPATLYVLYNNRGVMRVGQKGGWERGVEDLKRAAALRPDQYQAPASLAEAYRLAGRLDEAGRYLDTAVAVAGRQVAAGDVKPATLALLYRTRARLQLQRSDRPAALADLAEAARLAQGDARLRAGAEADRGRVLHLEERFDEALAAYDAALQADPGRLEVLRWRGEVLLTERRYPEAVAAFDAYLEKGGPPSAAVYRQRGLARSKLGRHTDAADDYGRALGTRPKDDERVPLYLSRGQEYLTLSALQPALHDFEEALRLDPGSADAHLGCAHVRVRLGDPGKAVAEAEQVVRGGPREPRLWHGAGRVYAQAAVLLRPAPGQEDTRAGLRARFDERAVVLLRTGLQLVPLDQRPAYWRENVATDASLYSLRRLPAFADLAARYGSPER